jgi:hypothetical protein
VRVTVPADVAYHHGLGWPVREIAEVTGRSEEEIEKLLAAQDGGQPRAAQRPREHRGRPPRSQLSAKEPPGEQQVSNAKPEPAVELDAFLNQPDPEYDWLVAGLLERLERGGLTGPEGGGKSELFRQLGVQFASGIHPFTLEEIDPLRVLLVDLENPTKLVRRKLRVLRVKAGKRYEPGNLHVVSVPQGMDLFGHAPDRGWLEDRVKATRPDVVLIGPLYKLAICDINDEQAARTIQGVLDDLRTRYGFALLIEMHSGHGTGGERRPTRPIGASAWLRWPEIGLNLSKAGLLTHWRGARDEREWPSALKRGGDWPWTTVEDPREQLWAQIRGWVDLNGRAASIRKLAEALGIDKSRVERALKAHKEEWDDLRGALGEVDS